MAALCAGGCGPTCAAPAVGAALLSHDHIAHAAKRREGLPDVVQPKRVGLLALFLWAPLDMERRRRLLHAPCIMYHVSCTMHS